MTLDELYAELYGALEREPNDVPIHSEGPGGKEYLKARPVPHPFDGFTELQHSGYHLPVMGEAFHLAALWMKQRGGLKRWTEGMRRVLGPF